MTDPTKLPTIAIKQPYDSEDHRNFLTALLLSLVFLLLVVPFVEALPFAESLLRLGVTAVLISAAVATIRRRELMLAGLFVAAIATPLTWATMFVEQPHLFLASCILESLFFVVMAVLIVNSVFRKHLASIHSISGAISAYLLLGLGWTVLYWGLDSYGERSLLGDTLRSTRDLNGSPGEVIQFSKCIYFSFVTMSTLGYGDITPATSVAQTLAWMQSVVGQFYMAVLVALLVSEIPRRHHHDDGMPLANQPVGDEQNSLANESDVPQPEDGS
ncbi:MAG TPA: two pore domain potassium channel family protein [Planctomycetes bacterium]|nr:two pore domain potassium channel family protein [Fuerstiella sp.]HIK91373.1 two pore domain potassium channel family protein [Planctomycetota bacterium]